MTKQANAPRPAAVLVGVQLPDIAAEEFEASLAELGRLVETLGFDVLATVTQKRNAFSPAALVGEGKLKEIATWTVAPAPEAEGESPARRAVCVVFDHDLTPNQLRVLHKATGAEVLDRSGVIVEIFHRHAKTREARL